MSTPCDAFSSQSFGRLPNTFPAPPLSLQAADYAERASSLMATLITDNPPLQHQQMLPGNAQQSDVFSPQELGVRRRHRDYSPSYDRLQYAHSASEPFVHDYEIESATSRSTASGRLPTRYNTRRRSYNQDEFDGPSHLLPPPIPQEIQQRAAELPLMPLNLSAEEQDEILTHVNTILSQCAFHFVSKYQFPIPIERDKPQVHRPSDREWNEWAFLLKRLATKRRIPARVLYRSQIKHLVTTLENSLDVKPSPRDHGRPLKDDRHILQLISAAVQVAKLLMDAIAMRQLDDLYTRSEMLLFQRRARPQGPLFS